MGEGVSSPIGISPTVKRRLEARTSILASWTRFISWSLTKQSPRWVFRGQSQHWPLRPSVGRLTNYKPEIELQILNEFKRHSVSYFDTSTLTDGWNWLALAQHHGLPTRLLDWTFNPLVAAYFASQVNSRSKKPGVIYAIEIRHFGFQDELSPSLNGPFEIDKATFLRTPTFVPRLKIQKGIFSVHPEPDKPFGSSLVSKFEIPWAEKIGFQRLLFNLGVDAGFLMADLDGLSASLRWRTSQGLLA